MIETLRIAFFGSSLMSAYWNGAATCCRGVIQALYDLGHRITFYEPDAFDRQRHRDLESVSYARSIVCRHFAYGPLNPDSCCDILASHGRHVD